MSCWPMSSVGTYRGESMIETVMTITAKNHLLKQNAGSTDEVFPLKYVVLGTGGETEAGMAKKPSGGESSLYNLARRFDMAEVLMQQSESAPDRFLYKLRLPTSQLDGLEAFSEIGFEDEYNNLLFIQCFEKVTILPQRHLIIEVTNDFGGAAYAGL